MIKRLAGDSDRIAIDFISVLGLPPVEYIALASELGCRQISIALAPFTANPHDYPLWSLRDDPQLRRDLRAAMREQDVAISLGEGFLLWPERSIDDAAADMDLMAELGAACINIVSLDPDRSRSFDSLARFAEMAQARALQATLEFMPGLTIGDLSTGMAAVGHAALPNFRLLLDAMHVFRSGATLDELAALDPDDVGYVQLCDVPLVSRHASYGEEARDNRLPPGEGELPLLDFLAAMSADVTIGLEVPMLDAARAGVGPRERLSRCVGATRDLLQQAAASSRRARDQVADRT